MALADTIAVKDPYMISHQSRVAQIACAIAEKMGGDSDFIEGIRAMSLLHDLGKLAVPEEILGKPGPLTPEEYDRVKIHPQIAYDILKNINFPWPVAMAVLQHHERLDGSGYPYGFSGRDIIVEARILAVADVVDAITSHRPYRPAQGMTKAFEEIIRNRGSLYDTKVVNVCLEVAKPQLNGLSYGRVRPFMPGAAPSIL
jgi:putative nucleotidyltransferase with HDIG domain